MEIEPEDGSALHGLALMDTKKRRRTRACDYCRAKKIRCNGQDEGVPCPNCIDRGEHCTITTARKRTRGAILTPDATVDLSSPLSVPQLAAAEAQGEVIDDHGLSCTNVEVSNDEPDDGGSIPSNDTTNWEYHGPRSYLSICSKAAVTWVNDKTRSVTFTQSAIELASYITGRLKMDADLSPTRLPDPDPETAWKYTKAYFDVALDASLGILDRPWYESKLASHLEGHISDSSVAWFALRNVVYAAGCRIELSRSLPFRETSQQAWRYFENALAVYARLILFKTSIMGVQALTLMAYFVQTLGTPYIEYMLISDAVRLAYAKGLHRATPTSRGLSMHEVNNRSCIFWAAYCLEKQIATQADRPSIINDDDVNCCLPLKGPICGALNLVYCHSLIRLSQVQSHTAKRLSSLRLLRTGVVPISQVVNDLEAELDHVLNALGQSSNLRLGDPVDRDKLPPGVHLEQLLHLQYIFLTSRLAIHSILSYPWVRALFGSLAQDTSNGAQSSAEIVAGVCRKIILLTENISPKAYTSLPIAIFGPLYATISLFVCHLDDKLHQSDLALMDVATGYFARLQLASDSIVSIQFVRQLTSLAYKYSRSPLILMSPALSLQESENVAVIPESDGDPALYDEADVFPGLAFEDWSALLPVISETDGSTVDFWWPDQQQPS